MLGWLGAARNTRDGLAHAVRHERPVRQEVAALALAVLLAPFIAGSLRHGIILVASIVLVLVVELLNVGIETVCDRITREQDAAIKIAKDAGSAAVALTVLVAATLWLEAAWTTLR